MLTGDVSDPAMRRAALDALGGPADLIVSDMAPKLSGIKARDEARCEELLNLALQTAAEMLKPGGAMIAKAFMSGDFAQDSDCFSRPLSRGRYRAHQRDPARLAGSFTWSRGISARRRTDAVKVFASGYRLMTHQHQGLSRCSAQAVH